MPKCVGGVSLMRSQCSLVLEAPSKKCMRLHEVVSYFYLLSGFFVNDPLLSLRLNLISSYFLKDLLLKAFRPWGGPAMPSALAVRGPGFPEDAPRKAGHSCHRRFCALPNWNHIEFAFYS